MNTKERISALYLSIRMKLLFNLCIEIRHAGNGERTGERAQGNSESRMKKHQTTFFIPVRNNPFNPTTHADTRSAAQSEMPPIA